MSTNDIIMQLFLMPKVHLSESKILPISIMIKQSALFVVNDLPATNRVGSRGAKSATQSKMCDPSLVS